jgi:hypothetical protein
MLPWLDPDRPAPERDKPPRNRLLSPGRRKELNRETWDAITSRRNVREFANRATCMTSGRRRWRS